MTVVKIGGQDYNIGGRVAAIIDWLLKNAEEIEKRETLKIEIDCGGRQVLATKTARDRLKSDA